jgi:L-fuconolactonase
MLIDSHHHLWEFSAEQYGWMSDEMVVLKRDYLAAELRQIAVESGVDGFVTVQARQAMLENDDLLAIAKEEPLIRGIVGWVPLADPDVGEALDRYAAFPLFKGVRHVVHDEPDDRFILGAEFNRGVAEIASRNLVYDVLIFAKHLAASIDFVDHHPSQPMVIDHIAKPTIRESQFDEVWESQFHDMAKRENVTCKFSGVVTEVRDETWSIDTIRPYWDVAIEAFTPKRLMFGSDWPVCLLKTSHKKWVDTVRELASELSADEQADLFANTAIKAYSLA